MPSGRAIVIRGNSRQLPLPDESVDLVVSSPPYYSLRSYTDQGRHYDAQIGAEPTVDEYIANLLDCTREWMRALKPTGSLFVNLGDTYVSDTGNGPSASLSSRANAVRQQRPHGQVRGKSADYAGVPGRGTCRPGMASEWTNANAAWLAAVLDCEGSISGRMFKDGRSFVVWMRVGMMDREVVERIYEITGVGRVYQDGRGVWHYNVASQAARYVLERIWPWLRIKQKRALAAIELCRHVEERAARQGRMLSASDLAYRTMITQAIRDWNGHPSRPNDYEPPTPPRVYLPDHPYGIRSKSLIGVPWRYALGCVNELGLTLRRDIIWNKPNGVPESVDDRCRTSHEYIFHIVKERRYFTGVDEIREPHKTESFARFAPGRALPGRRPAEIYNGHPGQTLSLEKGLHPAGRLPGSVWTIPVQPLIGPQCRLVWDGRTVCWFNTWAEGERHMRILARDSWMWAGVAGRPSLRAEAEHYAAFPFELPRRIIQGWSPRAVCCDCGFLLGASHDSGMLGVRKEFRQPDSGTRDGRMCPNCGSDNLRPPVILDPFGGTGCAALVAASLGRTGVSVDYSHSYSRFARWRTTSKTERAKAMQVKKPPPAPDPRQEALFDMEEI